MFIRIVSVLFSLALTLTVFAFAESARGDAISRSTPLPWSDPDQQKAEKLLAEMKADFGEQFQYRSVGPFLIATDMDKDEAEHVITWTIGVCVASLQRQLFTKAVVSEPVKVMLFKDGASYNSWNMKLYHEKPGSLFGYYSRPRRAMVMNIGTGAGTLVHEMIHAMGEVDFPGIPAWLNEGLGSLFEAPSKTRTGKVLGVKNWRLQGLLDDLAKGSAVHYRDLIGMSDTEFYGDRRSSNYASMRYLMQWLQEKGKLEAFYERVRDSKGESPQTALRAIFDDKLTIDELEAQVYAWVNTL